MFQSDSKRKAYDSWLRIEYEIYLGFRINMLIWGKGWVLALSFIGFKL